MTRTMPGLVVNRPGHWLNVIVRNLPTKKPAKPGKVKKLASTKRDLIMKQKQELTQELLKELLHYEPGTGIFTWKERSVELFSKSRHWKRWNTQFSGKTAGSEYMVHKKPYRSIAILGKNYYAHTLAFFYMTGRWPIAIDHINGSGIDNKWENLREAIQSENCKNMRIGIKNTSGYMGVSWHKGAGKWRVCICVNGKNKSLGLYKDIEDAAKAKIAANIKYGFHKNHGSDRPL